MTLSKRLGDALAGGLWLRPALYLACLVATGALVFAGMQTLRLGETRRALSAATGAQADLLNQLAAGTAVLADRTAAARAAFDQAIPQIAANQQRMLDDARTRHQGLVADIAAGNRRLRQDWVSGCPAAAAGERAGTLDLAREDPRRAAAVGRVLGIGASADATYQACRTQLTATENLLAACYEGGQAK